MRDILVVLTNPVNDTRHEEFNQWYTHVHIRDVMRMPSSIAVQRFILADAQPAGVTPSAYRYLAIYEIDDTVKCTAAHAVAMTPKLPLSDTFDLVSTQANYFRLSSFVTSDPLAARDGDVIIAMFDEPADYQTSAAERIVGRNGYLSAAHFRAIGDQLIPRAADHSEMALFRVTDPNLATNAWARLDILGNAAYVAHYRPLTARLTADQVLNADPESRENEARARRALGDKQHRLPV